MTSWMECGCGGDVTLYEEPGAEYLGRKWPILFAGNCSRCGAYHVEPPGNLRKVFAQARIDFEKAEIRRAVEEEEARKEEYRRYLSTLTPRELLAEVGPESYPWYHVFVHEGPLAEGQRAHGCHEHALDLDDARHRGTIRATPGQWITIEKDFERIESFQDGTVPGLKRYYVTAEHDWTEHDTGIYHESGLTTYVDTSIDECREWAERTCKYWLDRSATYFSWRIRDDDGTIEEHHRAKVMEAEE